MNAPDPLRAMAEAQRVLRAIAQGDDAGRWRLAAAQAAEGLAWVVSADARPAIVFAPAEHRDTWHVGPVGAERTLQGNGLGLVAAWLALNDERPLCADLAGPGATNPDSIVSRAVRQTAARWAEQIGRHELAAAFRRIHVKRGRLHYTPAAGAPPIVTRHVIPMSSGLHAHAAAADHASSSDEVNAP